VPFLWCFASGYVPWPSWTENPVCLALLVLLAPATHEAHVFLIHRASHGGPLYRWVHSVRHSSVIPSPWSSPSGAC
jgi:sterol desaturase/sphingolipid hydroxylase (fatty acid hydroxylase superfamily)